MKITDKMRLDFILLPHQSCGIQEPGKYFVTWISTRRQIDAAIKANRKRSHAR